MNKKIMKKALAVSVTAVAAAATVMGAAGCGDSGGRKTYDNDKDTLVFSSQDFDRVFNPFYSTSAMDANAVGMTQIGMISNDKDGQPVWGDDEAVVAKDLEIKTLGTPNVDEKTEYYFVLKNNVRFSDGSYLTMKDVLFNMYVYLDPAYTGSSTMYSTDIVGLQEYRTQAETEKEQEAFEKQFTDEAGTRIDNLTQALQDIKKDHSSEITMTSEKMIEYLGAYATANGDAYEHIVDDYNSAVKLFKEELQSDFNEAKDSYQDVMFTNDKGVVVKNLFTTDVEVFLYNEGYISWNKKENGGEGKLESSISNNVSEFKSWTEAQAINTVIDDQVPRKMDEVINYWATATNLAVEIAGDARETYFKTHTQKYKNIKGIEFINRTSPVTVNGVTYQMPSYNEDKSQVVSGNEVLKVTINDVDPKAIWNFSFGVAPMYYYSNSEQIEKFDYEENFGVEYGSASFMRDVIKDPDKIGVPVGAGPYMASSESDKTGDDVTSGDFLSNNVMYFRSNPHFIMGEPKIKHVRYQVVSTNQIMNSLQTGEIDFAEPNAKTEIINQLKGLSNKGMGYTNVQTAGYGYVGVNASKVPSIYVRRAIMHSIDTSLSVKYYDGTAKPIYRSMSLSSWAYPKSALSYYPYVGAPIPEDLSKVSSDYATFVSAKGFKAGYVMTEAEQIEFIKYLVEDLGGYKPNSSGIYFKGNDTLKYTFTIAGQENDHPAFTAMYQAGQFLTNKVGGFQITTKTDNAALSKLGTGSLAVWAAAWGSTIDPDMYQVYHMDSKATSVLNWGYPSIINNAGGRYDEEYRIVSELRDYIDAARKSNDNSAGGTRAILYEKALDLVMELAVELPMYQRDDLFAYNAFKIDTSTFTPENDRSAFRGLTADIHKLSLVTNLTK